MILGFIEMFRFTFLYSQLLKVEYAFTTEKKTYLRYIINDYLILFFQLVL
jgi:hypothetical protein